MASTSQKKSTSGRAGGRSGGSRSAKKAPQKQPVRREVGGKSKAEILEMIGLDPAKV